MTSNGLSLRIAGILPQLGVNITEIEMYFLTVPETGSMSVGCQNHQVPVRTLFLSCKQEASHCVPTWPFFNIAHMEKKVSLFLFLLYKATEPIRLGPYPYELIQP